MTADREYQLINLEKIFHDGALSPVFKRNPKYSNDGVPRIAYSDVMDNKYIIRFDGEFDGNSFWSEDTKILVEYDSIEDLVDDGWRLD